MSQGTWQCPASPRIIPCSMSRALGKDSSPGSSQLAPPAIKKKKNPPYKQAAVGASVPSILGLPCLGRASTREVCTHAGRETSPLSSTCPEQNPCNRKLRGPRDASGKALLGLILSDAHAWSIVSITLSWGEDGGRRSCSDATDTDSHCSYQGLVGF